MELLKELEESGFRVGPATMGENITTLRLNVLDLPTGAILSIGGEAKLEVTGLRNPCSQLDGYQKGLTAAVLNRDEDGQLVRRAGIMPIVLMSGAIRPGDQILVEYPEQPHRPLLPV